MSEETQEHITLPDSVSMGVDIVEISRMKKILERTPSFTRRIFSENERAYMQQNIFSCFSLCNAFCGEGSGIKGVGHQGFAQGIGPRDIEVVLSKGKASC